MKPFRTTTLAILVVTGLLACQGPTQSAGTAAIGGRALAGPTCPVVSEPPDEACADRPVAGAVLIVRTEDGEEALRLTTDADGRFQGTLAPGLYTLVPQPVDGLMGTAPEQSITIEGDLSADLIVTYDTGIR